MPWCDARGETDDAHPRVSVIIPTYNRGALLVRAIQSVLDQRVPNTEIVVVDDGSTDDTAERVRQLAACAPGIRYIAQENAGVVAARNRGLGEATGSYIAFLDSDDEWLPFKLRAQIDVLEARPDIGMCWTDMTSVDPLGQVINVRHLRSMYSAYRRADEATLFVESHPAHRFGDYPSPLADAEVRMGSIFPAIVRGNLVHTSTTLVRVAIARRVGTFDVALSPSGEDHDFHLRTARLAPVALIDHPLIRYRVGAEDQLTRPELELTIARNFLMTVDKAVTEGARGSAPRVPVADVRAARAEGHRWLARLELAAGRRSIAARHALTGVMHAPTGARQLQMLGRVLLPLRVEQVLRSRALRRRGLPSVRRPAD